MPADRAEPGRGGASAVGAIGVAPELAGADPGAKICGDAAGHLREDALFWRRRWGRVDLDHRPRHSELGKPLSQVEEVGDHSRPVRQRQPFIGHLADLRRVEADKNL